VTLLLVVAGVLIGLTGGSFVNVVVWRVPRGGSVVRPRSHCPGCEAGIRPRDEVPVVSWLLLRGRCRDCQMRISARYPLVELLTAAVFVALALRLHEQLASIPAFWWLGGVGVALALIDLDTKKLPDVLTLPSYAVGVVGLALAALAGPGHTPLIRALLGCAALYAFYFALAFAYPSGMGFGDVKLAGVLGLYLGWLGWSSVIVGAFADFLLGGVVSIALVLAGRAGRKSAIPFGPFMLAGTLIGILVGQPIADSYLHLTVG